MNGLRYLLLLSIFILAGCANEEHDDLKQWMKEQAAGMRGGVQEPPPLITPPIVSYSAVDKDSPFSPDKIRTKDMLSGNDAGNPALNHPLEYLEGFPLESLKLIGVINYSGKMFALIQTPEKPKHVTVGNFIGQNYGRITEITKTEVHVTESVKDANDLWVKREKVLYLQQDGGNLK